MPNVCDAQLSRQFVQNVPVSKTFMMFRSTDHITGATGATLTVQISKGSMSLQAPQGTIREIGMGLYAIDYTASDVNTVGDLYIVATATGCDATAERDEVITSTEAAASVVQVGLPDPPSAGSLILEAFRRGGVPDPTEEQLRRAEVEWLQEVKDEIQGRKRWHALEDTLTVPLTPNTQAYTIPAPLSRMLNLWVIDGSEILPLNGPNDGLPRTTQAQGRPRQWEEHETEFFLWPTPEKAYTLMIRGIVDLTLIDVNDARNTRVHREWRRAIFYGLKERVEEDQDDANEIRSQQKKEQQILRLMQEDGRKRRRMHGSGLRTPGGLPRWGRL
jgi:hypothetical protein